MNICRLKEYIRCPKMVFMTLAGRGLFPMSDEKYLKRKFKRDMGYELDLDNPRTFNEKLQWLKLYDRKPIYTTMVDKYAAKEYAAKIIGEEYIIPTLGVWDSFDEIDFDSLPEQFVLKCTHDSGGVVICKDKSVFDKKAARKKLNHALKRNYYYSGREWPYKDVKPRIIAEKYLKENAGDTLHDYKVFNFAGQPEIIQIDYDRFTEHTRDLYDKNWEYIDAELQYPMKQENHMVRPDSLKKMLDLAERLSKECAFLRTDFYNIENKLYVGELTFYPESGFGKFRPEEWDEKLGRLIKLPGGGVILGEGYILWLHEQYQSQKADEEVKAGLTDYKFMCFGGKVMCSLTCTGRYSDEGLRITFYDRDWNMLPFERHYHPKSSHAITKPENYGKMVSLAEHLSESIPFVRVDFYEVNHALYLGELTFYPGSGLEEFTPDSADKMLGEWIKLPESAGGVLDRDG